MTAFDWKCHLCGKPADYSANTKRMCVNHWQQYINTGEGNMEKKFSIIFPTRERVDLLKNILGSIAGTTANIKDIEVLVAYDEDDTATKNFIQLNSGLYPFVSWNMTKQSKNFSKDYYNWLFTMSTGKWIIVCNDDSEFRTQGWDTIAENAINAYIGNKPSVFMGWIEDGLGDARLFDMANYCCFPLFGRDGVKAVGYIFPERIPTWGADIWARKLYDTIGRVVVLPFTIFHLNHWNHTRPQDAVNKRIQDGYRYNPVEPSKGEILALKEVK